MTDSVRWRLRKVARARACPAAFTWFVWRCSAEGVLEPAGLEGGCWSAGIACCCSAPAAEVSSGVDVGEVGG